LQSFDYYWVTISKSFFTMKGQWNDHDHEIAEAWKRNYLTAPAQLEKMKRAGSLISAFNANIDAVVKIRGKKIEDLIKKNRFDEGRMVMAGERNIRNNEDLLRGLINCFRSGIAEEWLIGDEDVFHWLKKELLYDKLQMGGQGGIVANVMAVCGVNPVYVHCASLPAEQAGLFLNRNNLLTVDDKGELKKAALVDRKEDIPLVHWIIEFDKGDVLNIAGQTITCPKSNRFIATYDPLNFRLHIDKGFDEAILSEKVKVEQIILSGYQMLQETLDDGTSGKGRIDESIMIIKRWLSTNPVRIVHLEMASTQDRQIRRHLLDTLGKGVDSLGFNERELIDLLEVMGEQELAGECSRETNSVNLFRAMLKLLSYTGVSRLQLHMYGLYLTIQKRGFRLSPEKNRDGMQLASVIAAAKAGTGAIDNEDVLLWAKNEYVSGIGITELMNLSGHIKTNYSENDLLVSGIWSGPEFEVIAVPTILIDKPVTLVGMGDTISSVSLIAAL